MSTTNPTVKEHVGLAAEDDYVPVEPPAPMTVEKLIECNDVHDSDDADDERAVFAVAHQQGVVQNVREEREHEVMGVLYVTADGEQAVERWYHGVTPDHFEEVDRAFVAHVDALEPTGDRARQFAPVVHKHPEVDG